MRSLATTVALLLVALFLFANYVRRSAMFFPSVYPEGMWDTSAFAVRPTDQNFAADDGVALQGWLFSAPARDAPLIVWYHGNAGNITDRASVAAELARRGVSVFVFDWRGYGRSKGRPNESGLYRDAVAAYQHAVKNLQTPADRIVVYGESLGGPFAAYVASKHPVRAVIIENSFPSLRVLGNALYAPLPLGWSAPLAMNTVKSLNQAGRPVLVMHGKRDEVIPYRLGVDLYDQLKVPKQFLSCDEAGHCEIPSVDAKRYYETVVQFATANGPDCCPSPHVWGEGAEGG